MSAKRLREPLATCCCAHAVVDDIIIIATNCTLVRNGSFERATHVVIFSANWS